MFSQLNPGTCSLIRSWLASVFFSTEISWSKLRKKKKCFRCFWSILIACAASVTPWPWIHTQTHTHIVPPSFSWMNLLLELVGNWSAIPCGRRLTLFVMFNDLVSLWQDMMSLYKRNKELWLFDSSFPQWTLHNDVYTNEHTCRFWTSNSRLQLGSKSIWFSSKKPLQNPALYLLFVVPESFPKAVYLSSFAAVLFHITLNPTEGEVV